MSEPTTVAETEDEAVNPLDGFDPAGLPEVASVVRVVSITSTGQDPFAPARGEVALRKAAEAAGPEAVAALPQASAWDSFVASVQANWQSSMRALAGFSELPHPSVKASWTAARATDAQLRELTGR